MKASAYGRCVIAWYVWVVYEVRSSPNHDTIQLAAQRHTASQPYFSERMRVGRSLGHAGNAQGHLGTSLETCEEVHTKTWDNIRIGYEFVGADLLADDKSYVEAILVKAVAFLQKTIKVHRVSGPLRANRKCSSSWSDESKTCAIAAEATTCGADKIPIPEKYLNGLEVCTDSPGNGCSTQPEGVGVVDYDFYVFVSIQDTDSCSDTTQAYAGWCVKDQCDRPVFGAMNFCRAALALTSQDETTWVSTAVHELIHAMVFTSNLFAYFRNEDGTPRMARDPNTNRVLGEVKWNCNSGGTAEFPAEGGKNEWVDLSQAGIVVSVDERGFDSCDCPLGRSTMGPRCLVPADGDRIPTCVMKLTTPKVVEEVRNFFDCDTLVGAELENQDTGECVIVGSHWEQRIFNSELMASLATVGPVFLSRVTLALFEDSGWYKVDYSMADDVAVGVHWGYRQGCTFAEERCVTNGVTSHAQFFCTEASQISCALDRSSSLQCNLQASAETPAPVFSYFASGSKNDGLVGSVAEADFCPFFQKVVGSHKCSSADSLPLPFKNINMRREVFGPTSRCLDTTLRGDIVIDGGAYRSDLYDVLKNYASACYEIECAADAQSYSVHVHDVDLGSTIMLGTCTAANQLLSDSNGVLAGEIRCAAPSQICFAPAHHSSGGPWNRTTTTTTTGGPTTTSGPTTTEGTTTPTTTTTSTIISIGSLIQMLVVAPLTVGRKHACALDVKGAVVCWGDYKSQPPERNFRLLTAGLYHTCGISQSSEVECWGYNDAGQLNVPTGPSPLRFSYLAAGSHQTCGILVNGAVECWGRVLTGQSVVTTSRFLMLSIGEGHACGLTTTGRAVCWGNNDFGQISVPNGDGQRFISLSTGQFHTCGLMEDCQAKCWGSNDSGQTMAPEGVFFTMLTAGMMHTCGLTVSGMALCWGTSLALIGMPTSHQFAALAAGATHTCGLSAAGEVTCWGPLSMGPMNIPAGLMLPPQCTLANSVWHAGGSSSEDMLPCGGLHGGDPEALRCPAGAMAMGNSQCFGCRFPYGEGCKSCTVPVSCEECPKGAAGREGLCRSCNSAEIRTNVSGQKECQTCPAGHQPDSDNAICVACPRGTAGMNGTCETCNEDSLGSHSELLGLTDCQRCPRGKSPDPTRGICMPCPEGYLWRWSECIECSADKHDRGFWKIDCGADGTCPNGFSWREAGCLPCTPEVVGQEVIWKGGECIACPEGLKASLQGSCVDTEASGALSICSIKCTARVLLAISIGLNLM